jgi:GNAT superfamily N-acetyltransferase
MAISSPSDQLQSAAKLPDGTVIRLRPIRPEDETLLVEFAAHMSPEDIRLRFFAAMRGVRHELAARLSHIDDDRDVASLAFAESGDELLGVARLSADLDNCAAEFATAVRSDWKGMSLATLLMARLIRRARQRGIDELIGEVLFQVATRHVLQRRRVLILLGARRVAGIFGLSLTSPFLGRNHQRSSNESPSPSSFNARHLGMPGGNACCRARVRVHTASAAARRQPQHVSLPADEQSAATADASGLRH